MSAELLVTEFFRRVHAGDLAVCELYAEDGLRVDHEGKQFRGRDAIAEVYAALFPLPDTHPEVDALLVNPPFVAAVMRWPGREDPDNKYIDLFEIRDGMIQALWVLV